MASQQDDAVLDLNEDDRSSQSQGESEEDEDEEEDLSPSSAAPPVTIPAVLNGTDGHNPILALPTAAMTFREPKLHRIGPPPYEAVVLPSPPQLDRKPLPPDETRRLFQRLWTDEDEIELLQGFLEYSAGQRGPHPDTALFYDQIKSKLRLHFNKNQLVDKLRRLKKKYRTVLEKTASGKDFAFKSPHDQATFEISKKIWSSFLATDDEDGDVKPLDDLPNHPTSRKRSRSGVRQLGNSPAPTPVTLAIPAPIGVNISNSSSSGGDGGGDASAGANVNASVVTEDKVRSCLSPLFKELLSEVVLGAAALSSSEMFGGGRGAGGIGGLVMMNAMPLGFGFMGAELGMLKANDKWKKQQILELEVYSKRLELVQDQIRAHLDELRSMGSSGRG